jgi:hypothetical protein
MRTITLLTAMFAIAFQALAEPAVETYSFSLPDRPLPTTPSPIKMGTAVAQNGATLGLNVSYFLRDGKPWLPVMGEVHFSRLPRAEWDDAIVKMQACGIDLIATYVFWNHHEEIKDQWDWSDRRDLRAFVECCRKHKMPLWLRIGPWCHGEARHGGFPDYIQKAPNRRSDPAYLERVKLLYGQIAKQLDGLYFKDNGPIVGIQLENEFAFDKPAGYEHMKTLRTMAIAAGIDVPFYSATKWPASMPGQTEFLLGFGGYPEAPWNQSLEPMPPKPVFTYRKIAVDDSIGNDLLKRFAAGNEPETKNIMPVFTVELGGGNQVTWHRRPLIQPLDCPVIGLVTLGSGGNCLGYYMFHGGINPPGKLTTLQESRASGYPNDCPLINYDFQAPIGSEGQLNASYPVFRKFHAFVAKYGSDVATLPVAMPDRKPKSAADADTLRCALRGTRDHGYLFISNYQREIYTRDFPTIQFQLDAGNGQKLTVPPQPARIPKDYVGIWSYDATGKCERLLELSDQIAFLRPSSVTDIPDRTPVELPIEPNTATPCQPSPEIIAAFIKAVPQPLAKATAIWHPAKPDTADIWTTLDYAPKPGARLLLAFLADDSMELRINLKTVASGGFWNQITLWDITEAINAGKNEIHAIIPNKNGPGGFCAAFYQVDNNGAVELIHQTAIDHWQTILGNKRAAAVAPIAVTTLNNQLPYKSISGPRYGATLKAIPGATTVQFFLPANFRPDHFLDIRYVGDTAALYQDGKLINDDFLYGQSFLTRLSRIPDPTKPLVLQITPISTASPIFMPQLKARVQDKPEARVQRIEITKQSDATRGDLRPPVEARH